MKRLSIESYRVGLVLSIVWCGLLSANTNRKFPVSVSVYDFSVLREWNFVRMTELRAVDRAGWIVDSAGVASRDRRWAQTSVSLHGTLDASYPRRELTGAPTYNDLQAPSLDRMLQEGLIPKVLYDEVVDKAPHWKPGQVRFAVAWSELSLSEAREAFGGKIPWDRVMGPRSDKDRSRLATTDTEHWESIWPRGRPLRIVRSIVMSGSGYEWDPIANALLPRKMAWESQPIYEDHGALAVDRKRIPFVAELSRAYVARGVLPGDLSLPISVLLEILRREADVLGRKRSPFLIFSRALLPKLAVLYYERYGFRDWSEMMRLWWQEWPDAALADYEKSVPRTRNHKPDVVMVANLEHMQKRFMPPWADSIAERPQRLRQLSQGMVSEAEAFEVQRTWSSALWRYFVFPGDPRPVCVHDHSVLANAELAQVFIKISGAHDEGSNAIVHELQREGTHEPNAFSWFWNDRGWISPSRQVAHERYTYIRIDNLSVALAEQNPLRYLSSVFATIYAYYEEKLLRASTLFKYNVLHGLYQIDGLPWGTVTLDDVQKLRVEDVLKSTPIAVATSNPKILQQLRELGGVVYPTERISPPTAESNWIDMRQLGTDVVLIPKDTAWWVEFRWAQLEKILVAHKAPFAIGECSEAFAKVLQAFEAANF